MGRVAEIARQEADGAALAPLALGRSRARRPRTKPSHAGRFAAAEGVQLEIVGAHVLVQRVERVDLLFAETPGSGVDDLDVVGFVEGGHMMRLVVAVLAAEEAISSASLPSTSSTTRLSGAAIDSNPSEERRWASPMSALGRSRRTRTEQLVDPHRYPERPAAGARARPGSSRNRRRRAARVIALGQRQPIENTRWVRKRTARRHGASRPVRNLRRRHHVRLPQRRTEAGREDGLPLPVAHDVVPKSQRFSGAASGRRPLE